MANRARILATVAVVAIAAGGVLHAFGAGAVGHHVWQAAVALLSAELAVEVARTIAVDRHLGVDTIALVAMVGALALGEELAGAVIGLMFSGGAALEAAASRRARRELTALVQKRFKFQEGSVELYAEKVRPACSALANSLAQRRAQVQARGLSAVAQAESLRYKLLGGLAVRRCALTISLESY